jgi:hypothetical protein
MLEVMEDCSAVPLRVRMGDVTRSTLFWKLASHSAQLTATRTHGSRSTRFISEKWLQNGVCQNMADVTHQAGNEAGWCNVNFFSEGTSFESQPGYELSSLRPLFSSVSTDVLGQYF